MWLFYWLYLATILTLGLCILSSETVKVIFLKMQSVYKYEFAALCDENLDPTLVHLPKYLANYLGNNTYVVQPGINNFRRCYYKCGFDDQCASFAFEEVCEIGYKMEEGVEMVNVTQAHVFVNMNLFTDYLNDPLGPCNLNSCEFGGTCTRIGCNFECDCHSSREGERCQTDVNECNSNPCQNGGTCNNDFDSYSCSCYVGYIGDNCQNTVIRPISIVGQSAYTSSPQGHINRSPERAVDGNHNTNMFNNGCFHSSVTVTEPLWWGVDLGRDMYVSSVHITNRGDCCGHRLKRFRAFVSSDTVNPVNSTDKQLCAEMPGTYSAVNVDVPCDSSIYGRYLIFLFDFVGDPLNFCEVEIDGFFEEDLLT